MKHLYLFVAVAMTMLVGAPAQGQTPGQGQTPTRLEVEFEAGPVWQSRNDIQIPNDETGTRFSAVDAVGSGPWPAARIYLTWNFNEKHSVRALLAPLTITEDGGIDEQVEFNGDVFDAGLPTEVTYKFNSWRIGYRYRFHRGERSTWRVGFTAKIRDAKIRLEQPNEANEKTDVGFVPLLHLSGDYRLAPGWRAILDFEGLAGGPGRAFDVAVKLSRDLGDRASVTAGYRTIEGGADVDSVYNFAWLHYLVGSLVVRF